MSRNPQIDDYIAKAQPFAQEILNRVRERVHAVLPDAEEQIKWRMPAYLVDGKLVLMTAAFKAHAELKFWRGQDIGKLNSVRDLPPDQELDRLISEAAEVAKSESAPRKAKHSPKPLPEMHPDFASALAKTAKAKAAFDSFPPSHRREYLEWIAEAKRDETRQKRIATAIEWLSEGKGRNWRYE